MKDEYDLTNAKPNPYYRRLTTPTTIRLSNDVIAYFKSLAEETGVPYQTLINMFLMQCVNEGRRPQFVMDPQPDPSADPERTTE